MAVDLDPQANLTAAFLDGEEIEGLWPASGVGATVVGTVSPLLRGIGDIGATHVRSVDERLTPVPGDLSLSGFEDELSSQWPACLDGRGRAFPDTYRSDVLGLDGDAGDLEHDPTCLAQLKHYRSLIPMAQDAREPVFELKPADGAFGGHQTAVRGSHRDVTALARAIAAAVDLALPDRSRDVG